MGDFPQGEAPGASGEQSADSGGQSGTEGAASSGQGGVDGGSSGAEPGFGDGASGGESLPDLRDEPSFEQVMAGMEGAMGESGSPPGGGQQPGDAGTAGGAPGASDGSSGSAGSAGSPDGTGTGAAGGVYTGGLPGGGAGGGSGPLTPAEQVAILDARLEQGTGEFDSMILEEQAQQRSSSRQRPQVIVSESGQGDGSGSGSGGEGDMADAGGYGGGGGYSTGGGMGGIGGNRGEPPKDAAKYPPPADIPNGNDDDVVARQLREAAMREPDPAVREKLWDEYRKYKGISE